MTQKPLPESLNFPDAPQEVKDHVEALAKKGGPSALVAGAFLSAFHNIKDIKDAKEQFNALMILYDYVRQATINETLANLAGPNAPPEEEFLLILRKVLLPLSKKNFDKAHEKFFALCTEWLVAEQTKGEREDAKRT